MLERELYLLRVALREPDRHERGVEVVEVEVVDRAAEDEASGLQGLVGDGVVGGLCVGCGMS